MSIRTRLIAAALLATALATASTTFTPLGWTYANVNGTGYSTGQTLPSTATFFTYGTQSFGSASAGALTKANKADTSTQTATALFNAGYRVSVSTAPTANTAAYIIVNTKASTSANAIVYRNNCYAAGQAGAIPLKLETATQDGPGDNEGTDQVSNGRLLAIVQSSLFTATSGVYSATFNIPIKPAFASATAVSNGGAGNFTASQAGGSGGYSVNPTSLSFHAPGGGGGGGIVTAYAQGFLTSVTVQVVQTSGGTLVDAYDSLNDMNGFSGFGVLTDSTYTPGTYSVYVKAPGSLRKKLTMTVTANGVAGLDSTDATLKFGDLDGDGTVSQTEVNYVYSKIGTDISNPANYAGAYTPGQTLFPYMADLNNDMQVTQADYNLAYANLGQSGD